MCTIGESLLLLLLIFFEVIMLITRIHAAPTIILITIIPREFAGLFGG